MFIIQDVGLRVDISAETLPELKEKLKFLNPMFLDIAKNILRKKYRIIVEDSGEKISFREREKISIVVIHDQSVKTKQKEKECQR